MSEPVSQFITSKVCIIQGVMKDHSEINYIYCPDHKKTERVHSFSREVDLRKHPSKKEVELSKRLQASTEEATKIE